jgi:hypothetical protein
LNLHHALSVCKQGNLFPKRNGQSKILVIAGYCRNKAIQVLKQNLFFRGGGHLVLALAFCPGRGFGHTGAQNSADENGKENVFFHIMRSLSGKITNTRLAGQTFIP